MARFTSWGWEERASLEAEGRGLSLNFYTYSTSVYRQNDWDMRTRSGMTDLVEDAAILVQTSIYGLDVFLSSF